MAFLSKYGVARHIYIPVIKAGVTEFAVSADWTPAAGDVKISKDGGAAVNVTNLPTAITMGNGAIWDFSITSTEMQAAQVVVTVVDAATKAVTDQSFIIETYGNASAQHPVDLADSVRAGLTALPNVASGSAGAIPTTGTGANQIAVDGSGNAFADVKKINASATAASNVSQANQDICRGVCSGGSTTTAICSSITTPSSLTDAGQLIGRTITFDSATTTANLQGQSANITNSTTGATPTITFGAMTHAPANGDTFTIV